jgi:hypothetical protein
MKREGAARVYVETKDMSEAQELKYWQEAYAELVALQRKSRKRAVAVAGTPRH